MRFGSYFEGLVTEGTSEVGMSVLGVASDDCCEVADCILMVVYHLVALGSFVQIPDVAGHSVDTPTERPNCLFKLLNPCIRQSDMVVYISFVSQEGSI